MKLFLASIGRCMGSVVNWKLRSEMTNVMTNRLFLSPPHHFMAECDFVAIRMSPSLRCNTEPAFVHFLLSDVSLVALLRSALYCPSSYPMPFLRPTLTTL